MEREKGGKGVTNVGRERGKTGRGRGRGRGRENRKACKRLIGRIELERGLDTRRATRGVQLFQRKRSKGGGK